MITSDFSTIAILGGAGKAGRPLVQQALDAGYRVRVLVRRPEALDIRHERLEIRAGDARDPDALRGLLEGCQALISTLGHPRGEPVPIMASVTVNYLRILKELGIRRCLVVTSLLFTGTEALDEATRQAADFMQQHFPAMMDERRREFRLLAESGLDWTYVRIPMLVPGPVAGEVVVNLNHLPGPQIAGPDLARFLVDQLTDAQYHQRAPYVASRIED